MNRSWTSSMLTIAEMCLEGLQEETYGKRHREAGSCPRAGRTPWCEKLHESSVTRVAITNEHNAECQISDINAVEWQSSHLLCAAVSSSCSGASSARPSRRSCCDNWHSHKRSVWWYRTVRERLNGSWKDTMTATLCRLAAHMAGAEENWTAPGRAAVI